MVKESMTSLDINIALEMLSHVADSYIDNIYSLEDEIFLFKLRGVKHPNWKNPFLLIEPGRRIHLTKFKRNMPEKPSNKLTALRKHVKGRRIADIHQHGFDRVVIIELAGEQNGSLFIELFGRGNLILVEKRRVIFSLWYRKMRDRDLLPGKPFEFPPARGSPLLEATPDDLMQVIKVVTNKNSEQELVKTLVKNFGASGQLVEEVLKLANIQKNLPVSEFKQQDTEKIEKALNAIKTKMFKGPAGILEIDGRQVAAVPFPFESLLGTFKEKKDFNEALDDFFSPVELTKSKDAEQHKKRINQLKKMLDQQISHSKKLKEQAESYKLKGDVIFLHLHVVQELFDTIITARRKDIDWKQIKDKLALGKQKNLPAAMILKAVYPDRKIAALELDDIVLEVDFTLKPTDVANAFYKASKKAEGKLKPAREAINTTREKIEQVEQLKEEAVRRAKKIYKKRERRWYEHYHWTKTKNGFLVIGGRDMKSNDSLVKKRMGNRSLFFHADVQGAPYVILMPDSDLENRTDFEPNIEDISEAARMAGVYSKAWKVGLGSVDVYHVTPEQVSYTAPSGEYIPKGGIMIRGKRNYIRGIALQITLGVILTEEYAMVIGGSLENVKQKSSYFVTIKPSEDKKGAIAKRVKAEFLKKVPKEKKYMVERLDLNEIVAFIP
ncbi:MAG: ribosome rescue protein RqcH [Candidatus Hodarchaeales archaeon]|jgi:predicted ribosome quality control (RQC) complex YloA/Tae2 family protein